MTEHAINSSTFKVLIEQLRQGEDAAFTKLISRTAGRLESLARHMLRGYPALRRWVETDDVLQNSLMRLVRALQQVKVESPRHFMALSALQIRRELIDLARHFHGPAGLGANYESRAGDDPSQRADVNVADVSHEPSILAQWREFHEQIGSLPDHEREAFDLLFYEGLSQKDAAKVLDTSVRTIQRRWHSALLMIHERVGNQWPGM